MFCDSIARSKRRHIKSNVYVWHEHEDAANRMFSEHKDAIDDMDFKTCVYIVCRDIIVSGLRKLSWTMSKLPTEKTRKKWMTEYKWLNFTTEGKMVCEYSESDED